MSRKEYPASVRRWSEREKRYKWYARYRLPDGKQRTQVCDTREEKLEVEAAARKRRKQGAWARPEPSKQAVCDYLDEWFLVFSRKRHASTLRVYGGLIETHIKPYYVGQRLCDVTPLYVRRWLDALTANDVPSRQRNHARAVLSSALGKWGAYGDGLIEGNPVEGSEKLREDPAAPVFLTPLEVERVRAAMTGERERLLVSVMAYGGLRPGEALALQWGDVRDGQIRVCRRFVDGVLSPGTKTGAPRYVGAAIPLVAALAAELAAARPADAAPGDWIAPNRYGNPFNEANWARRFFKRACETAGVTATPYDLRHTAASLWANEGRLMLAVMAELGHSDVKTTQGYQHLFSEHRLAHRTPLAAEITKARRQACAKTVRKSKRLPVVA